MDDQIARLQKLGWEWRQNGVILRVQVSGRNMQVFVPLARVWVTFDQELAAVGCPLAPHSVGEPFSVGGFFSSIAKAVTSVAPHKLVKKVLPKSITKAINKVEGVAKKYAVKSLQLTMKPAQLIAHATRNVPILNTITRASEVLTNLPNNAAAQLIQGKRIDQVAIGNLKRAIGATRELAPYVQTVISFVPGIGTGVSAGIGGALALAEGRPITEAILMAAKSAIPGGPAAQMAFNVAQGLAQHKPIDQLAIAALPISDQAKKALIVGVSAAKDLAAGKRVDQALIDNATKLLPPAVQKAVQVGVAMGHAKSLQEAMMTGAKQAAGLALQYAAGSDAAKKFMSGIRTPAIVQAMQRAATAKGAMTNILRQAQGGHPNAFHIVNALQQAPQFRNAMALAASHQSGVAAARAFASGNRSPAVVQAMHNAVIAKQALATVASHAQSGNPQARAALKAMQGVQQLFVVR